MNSQFGHPEAVRLICIALDNNKGVFSKSEEKVIRYWGRYNGKNVVYSSKKAAQILGVAPQTVQNWFKPNGKWGKYHEDYFGDCGYDIPLDLIIEEKRARETYGSGPKDVTEKFVWVTLDDIK